MLYSDDLYLSPARSKRGNLGPCPRPWRRVVTDTLTHSYLPDLGRYRTWTMRAMELGGGGRTRAETGVGRQQEGRGQRDADARTPTKLISHF